MCDTDYLQQDCVIAAQRSNLKAALDHIDLKYGGISNYVTRIGLTDFERKSICNNILQRSTAIIRCSV